jgi:hypothetical protein
MTYYHIPKGRFSFFTINNYTFLLIKDDKCQNKYTLKFLFLLKQT